MVVSGFALGRLLDCPDLPTKLSPIPRISTASPVQTCTALSIFMVVQNLPEWLNLCNTARWFYLLSYAYWSLRVFSGHCGNRLVYDQGCLDAQHLTVAQLPAFPVRDAKQLGEKLVFLVRPFVRHYTEGRAGSTYLCSWVTFLPSFSFLSLWAQKHPSVRAAIQEFGHRPTLTSVISYKS